MRRLLLLFILSVVILHVAQGQSIYSSQMDANLEIRFSSSRKANQYTNQVLKQLALANLKIPEKTAFNFFFSYGTSISFQHNNQLEVSLALTPLLCTGDILVRDFNLEKLLVPAKCAVRLSVINPVRGEVFASYHDDISLNDLLAGTHLATFPDSIWTAGSRLEVGFRDFGFDEPSYKRIERELFAIRDYDAAASLVEMLDKQIRQARIRQTVPEEAFRFYVLCNKGVYLLKEALKTSTEIVPGNDPHQLFDKVRVVAFQFNDLADFYLTEGIAGPVAGNAYLNQARAFSNAMYDAMKLSQSVDYYSSPFFYRLYSNSSTTGQLFHASKTIKKFVDKRGLRNVSFSLLSRRLADEYLRLGRVLMEEGRYAEAVDLLSSAEKFCRANPAIPVQKSIITELAKARSGLTSSYIRIVQKALDNNLPTLADKYLSEAMQYSARYGMSSADSAGFAGLYSVLSGKNIQSGNNYLANRDFQAALVEFDKAANIAVQFNLSNMFVQAEQGQVKAVHGIYCGMVAKAELALKDGNPENAALLLKEARTFADSYPVYRVDPVAAESLNTGIALVSYNSYLKKAARSALDFDYDKSVEMLLKATALSREYPISHPALFDSLVEKAGMSKINSLFSEGRLKLWAGEPEAALKLAGEAIQLASFFGIGRRQEIQQQYLSLMGIADETLCNRVKGELTSLINRTGESYKQNKFDEASAFVFQARELIYSKAACGLNTLELNKLTEKYQHPVRWNEMLRSAQSLVAAGDYFRGIDLIQQAGAIYTYFRLDTLGLANTGLFELAVNSDYLPFLRHATGFYINRGGFDEALQLLENMREAGAAAHETRELQESLARGLAQRDLAETELLNLKTMLNIYTRGDKWYRRFADVYRYYVENR